MLIEIPLPLIHVAHQDALDLNLLAFPIEGERVLLLGEPDAKGEERKLDQGRVQNEIQAGEHRHDGRPDVVVGSAAPLPLSLVFELAVELARAHLGRIAEGHPVELVSGLDHAAALGGFSEGGEVPEFHAVISTGPLCEANSSYSGIRSEQRARVVAGSAYAPSMANSTEGPSTRSPRERRRQRIVQGSQGKLASTVIRASVDGL